MLIGAHIIYDMDGCAANAREFIQTPTPYEPLPYNAIPPDTQCREVLTSLSDEQKRAVSQLIEHTLANMIHRMAISFDLCRYGPILFKLIAVSNGVDELAREQEIDALPMNGCDYSFDALAWLELFSQYENRSF